MSLSPIAQYCIRKLLRQHSETLDCPFLTASNASGTSDDAIEYILHQVASGYGSFQLQELELLTKLYQQLERDAVNENAIAEIKRRIFQTLGFQFNAIQSTQMPIVLSESAIVIFRFFQQNQVREGLRYNNALYAAVYQFDTQHRLQAYQIAWALSKAKVSLVVTLSPTRLLIWINLQSPSYPVLIRQEPRLLKTILLLNLVLQNKAVRKRATKYPQRDLFDQKVGTVFPKATDSSDH